MPRGAVIQRKQSAGVRTACAGMATHKFRVGEEDRTGEGWQLQLDGASGHRARSLAALQSPSLDGPGKLPLRVEELSARGEIVQVMVCADHPMIAHAAFRATVQQYPKSRIRL